MRAPLAALAGLVLAGSLLVGCGSDSGGGTDVAADPDVSDSPSATPTATPSGRPVPRNDSSRAPIRCV